VNGKYDIVCEHSKYSDELIRKLHSDTTNIAILREPMSHLRSVFNYFEIPQAMHLQNATDPVATFLENPRRYIAMSGDAKKFTQGLFASLFGFNRKGRYSLQQYVTYIESRFLVLIMEYLPESMILMKRKLCWSMKDVMYFHAKERHYAKPAVNDTLVKLHKAWDPTNYIFYEHFLQVMKQSIANQPNGFPEEVNLLKTSLQTTSGFCMDVCSKLGHMIKHNVSRTIIQSVLEESVYFEGSLWDEAYHVSGMDCLLMTLSNIDLKPALDVQLVPGMCSNPAKHQTFQVNKAFCGDYFAYTLPWHVLYHPHFHTSCYTV
jgi:hypothetical protein